MLPPLKLNIDTQKIAIFERRYIFKTIILDTLPETNMAPENRPPQ